MLPVSRLFQIIDQKALSLVQSFISWLADQGDIWGAQRRFLTASEKQQSLDGPPSWVLADHSFVLFQGYRPEMRGPGCCPLEHPPVLPLGTSCFSLSVMNAD